MAGEKAEAERAARRANADRDKAFILCGKRRAGTECSHNH